MRQACMNMVHHVCVSADMQKYTSVHASMQVHALVYAFVRVHALAGVIKYNEPASQ